MSDIKRQLEFDGRAGEEKAYQKLYDLLKEDSKPLDLTGLSRAVIKKVELYEKKKRQHFYLILAAGILFFLVGGFSLIIIFKGWAFLQQFSDITSWAILCGILVALIQYLDHKFIRRDTALPI